jgi:hypothetical protein
MKRFKLIDLCTSTALIIFFTLYVLIDQSLEILFYAYFITGSWQVISMLVHNIRIHSFFPNTTSRKVYHWIAFISLLTFPLGSYYLLLYAAPIMAVYYTVLCYKEWKELTARPLSVLK